MSKEMKQEEMALTIELVFDAEAFDGMKVLLLTEIQDLETRLQKVSQADDFNDKLFKDLHYTLLTKLKTLHLVREIAMGYQS